jgi:hypothetical protein
VPSSGIIDLAIGLAFVFGVTSALASVVTELIARLIGLRAAYLLSGLRELIGEGGVNTDLMDATLDYQAMRNLIRSSASPGAAPAPAPAPVPAPVDESLPAIPGRGPSSPPRLPSATAALLGGPILGNQGMAGEISSRKLVLGPTTGTGRLPRMRAKRTVTGGLWSQRRSLPSYISATSFGEAVIDLLVPDADAQITMTTIRRSIDVLPTAMPFRTSLQALASNAPYDVNRFRAAVERWYDDHMDRVSGWYKRHVGRITLAFGAILVVLLNINALTIGRTLYTQSTVSTAISSVAANSGNCPAGQDRQACLEDLQSQLSAAAAAGLPIGWGTVRDCTAPRARCNWLDKRGIFSQHGNSGWQLVLVLIGFLIMIIAQVPGAQTWFGLLSKLGSIRAAGPKPAAAGS